MTTTGLDINQQFALQVIKSNPHTAAIFNEMLEALEQLSKWCDDNLNGCPAELGRIQDLAEAAIQKARGGQ